MKLKGINAFKIYKINAAMLKTEVMVVPIWKGIGERQFLFSVVATVLDHMLLIQIRFPLLNFKRFEQAGFTPA